MSQNDKIAKRFRIIDDNLDDSDDELNELNKKHDDELKLINQKKIDIINDKLYCLITDLEDNNSEYYNFDKIKNDFIKSLKANCEGRMNRCVECGRDMGRSNPRQLCGKTFCFNI